MNDYLINNRIPIEKYVVIKQIKENKFDIYQEDIKSLPSVEFKYLIVDRRKQLLNTFIVNFNSHWTICEKLKTV